MRLGTIMAIAMLTAACAENTTVYHNRGFDPLKTRALTVDSYQRSTFFTNVKDGKENELRVCAEAAPDTFAALSASIAAEGDVKTQQARLAAAISQSGATIERTQTINLLRESLYRTCERYLSGAISKATLVVQAARDQRTMVTVLAIEQLTRTIRPPSTVISAGATSAALPVQKLVDMVVDARKDRDDAAGAVKLADKTFADSLAIGDCVATTTVPADNAAKPKLDDWKACNLAKAEQATAHAKLDAAEIELGRILSLGADGAGIGKIEAVTQAGVNNAGGGGASPESIKDVADAIVAIVNRPSINEVLMFCIGFLGKNPDYDEVSKTWIHPDPITKEMCNAVIKDRALLELYNTRQLDASFAAPAAR